MSSTWPVPSVSRRSVLGGLGAAAALALVGCSGDEDPGDEADGPVPQVVRYGDAPLQQGALSRPAGTASVPVVVLVHGGFWQPGFDRSLMDPLAVSVVEEGWAAWNLDYRPIGEGGGWPSTFTDVGGAVDHLEQLAAGHHLDLDRVAVVGHSAGGTLALWSGARAGLPEGVPGAAPVVEPMAVVAQAGVTNLAAAAIEGLGRGAAEELMGGQPTGAAGDDYLYASPIERLPLGPAVGQLLVHGTDDAIVPPVQSETYAARADADDDDVTLELVDGDHFTVTEPGSPAWVDVVAFLTARFG